ncbi:hypothetical protein EMIT0158MI4_130210 [Burkholderia ambifaria]
MRPERTAWTELPEWCERCERVSGLSSLSGLNGGERGGRRPTGSLFRVTRPLSVLGLLRAPRAHRYAPKHGVFRPTPMTSRGA